jgi:hypothetical protein
MSFSLLSGFICNNFIYYETKYLHILSKHVNSMKKGIIILISSLQNSAVFFQLINFTQEFDINSIWSIYSRHALQWAMTILFVISQARKHQQTSRVKLTQWLVNWYCRLVSIIDIFLSFNSSIYIAVLLSWRVMWFIHTYISIGSLID